MGQTPWDCSIFAINKFLTFCGTRKFIYVFSGTCHLRIPFTPTIDVSVRSIYCYLSTLPVRSDFPVGAFVSSLFCPYVPHAPPISCCLCDYPNSICWRVNIMKLIIMHFSSVFSSSPTHWSRYFPQHPDSNTLTLSAFISVSQPHVTRGKCVVLDINLCLHSAIRKGSNLGAVVVRFLDSVLLLISSHI
jgi:hypothetical protein